MGNLVTLNAPGSRVQGPFHCFQVQISLVYIYCRSGHLRRLGYLPTPFTLPCLSPSLRSPCGGTRLSLRFFLFFFSSRRSQSDILPDLFSNRLFVKLVHNEYDVLSEVSCKNMCKKKGVTPYLPVLIFRRSIYVTSTLSILLLMISTIESIIRKAQSCHLQVSYE